MVTLLPHQVNALARVEGHDRVAFYHDMGLGKTFVGAEKAVMFNDKQILVVCQKSKVHDWIEHFECFYNRKVYDFTKKCDTSFNGVAVINYDLLTRREDLLKLRNFTLMLDESSMIQNENAKRTKVVLKMKPSHIILLSGTPVGGKYEHLYSQLKLLGVQMNKSQYWEKFIRYHLSNFGGYDVKMVDGYKNTDELIGILKGHGADFIKTEEVINLPEQRFIPVVHSVTKEYKQLLKTGFTEWHDDEMIADNPLKRLLYLRCICATSSERMKALSDLLESTSKRVVVFYNFNAELFAMKKIVGERRVSVVNGTIKDTTNFMNHEYSVLFVQYQSGAMGLNLQIADIIIYNSLPLSSELYEQSKKRIHRVGQTRPCTYYILKCMNSVEEKIEKTLNMRKDYTDKLFTRDYGI